MMLMMLIQRDELENDRASLSDESGPDEIEPKLLRKQLLEVSGVFFSSASFSFCFTKFEMIVCGSDLQQLS